MPPGTEAPTPPPTNPTTRRVRPGTITNKGQPYWVRSTPRTTTPRAKMPTTTRTTPRAALEPPPRGRTGWGELVTYSGGVAIAIAAEEGSTGSIFSTGASVGADSAAATTGSVAGASAFAGSSSVPHLGAQMLGLSARQSGVT